MLEIRKSADRGQANHGWLNSQHSFSFAHYYDPKHMGFGPLRVINEDKVRGGQGFGTHGHRDMEIISYVLDGALEHLDSMKNTSVLRYGDVQRMSAGSGVQHSEYNHSKTEEMHFLQIWIEPNVQGISPGYEEKHFDPTSKSNQLRLIAAADGKDGSVLIHQDVSIYAAILDGSTQLEYALAAGRAAYVQVIRGEVEVNGVLLVGGDALKIQNENLITLAKANGTELLLFDLPYGA